MKNKYIDVGACARLSCLLTREEYDASFLTETICFDLAQDHARDDGLDVPVEAKEWKPDNAGAGLLEYFDLKACLRACRT